MAYNKELMSLNGDARAEVNRELGKIEAETNLLNSDKLSVSFVTSNGWLIQSLGSNYYTMRKTFTKPASGQSMIIYHEYNFVENPFVNVTNFYTSTDEVSTTVVPEKNITTVYFNHSGTQVFTIEITGKI